MQRISQVLTLALLCTALGGCSIYKLSMRQGNVITQKEMTSLHQGMTRSQVKAVLGTPLIQDPFENNRWDYVFYYRPAGGKVIQRTVSVYFQNGKVARYTDEGDIAAASHIHQNEQFLRGQQEERQNRKRKPLPPTQSPSPVVPSGPQT